MERRRSAFARILAVIALLGAAAALYLVISSGLEDDPASNANGKSDGQAKERQQRPPRTKAATYEIKPGDTLAAISYRTGISVQELKALNPDVDPLALIAGEELQLRETKDE